MIAGLLGDTFGYTPEEYEFIDSAPTNQIAKMNALRLEQERRDEQDFYDQTMFDRPSDTSPGVKSDGYPSQDWSLNQPGVRQIQEPTKDTGTIDYTDMRRYDDKGYETEINPADPTTLFKQIGPVSDRTERLITRLTGSIDTEGILGSDNVNALMREAERFGVDPVAAAAIFGIESNFGRNTGDSSKGAKGGMQVMPAQAKRLGKWFRDPANLKAIMAATGKSEKETKGLIAQIYRASEVANQQVGGTVAQGDNWMVLGIAQLLYNKAIGLDINLWGAGYQGNANTVLKKGAPLDVSDGNISNSDYNTAYKTLYNKIHTMLTGGTITTTNKGVMGSQPLQYDTSVWDWTSPRKVWDRRKRKEAWMQQFGGTHSKDGTIMQGRAGAGNPNLQYEPPGGVLGLSTLVDQSNLETQLDSGPSVGVNTAAPIVDQSNLETQLASGLETPTVDQSNLETQLDSGLDISDIQVDNTTRTVKGPSLLKETDQSKDNTVEVPGGNKVDRNSSTPKTADVYVTNPSRLGWDLKHNLNTRKLMIDQGNKAIRRLNNRIIELEAMEKISKMNRNTPQVKVHRDEINKLAAEVEAVNNAATIATNSNNNNIMYLQGMQSLQDLRNGSTARAGAVLSAYSGFNVQIVPRSDGLYDVEIDGKVTETLNYTDLSNKLQRAFDGSYRQNQQELMKEKLLLDWKFGNDVKLKQLEIMGQLKDTQLAKEFELIIKDMDLKNDGLKSDAEGNIWVMKNGIILKSEKVTKRIDGIKKEQWEFVEVPWMDMLFQNKDGNAYTKNRGQK
tara:strand:+ start:139 stop:2499 length:2361 start_codon:yes stop_codon:yes gene_type:complete